MSKTTVAAVLNHPVPPWSLSAETRERIIAAAAQLQYRPNAVARALANRRTQTDRRSYMLGAVVSGEFNDYFLETIKGIAAAGAPSRSDYDNLHVE